MNPNVGITTQNLTPLEIRAHAAEYNYYPTPVKIDAGQGTLAAGTILGKVTSSGFHVPYDDDGTNDGRRVAVGILGEQVNTALGDDPIMSFMYIQGTFIEANLTGLDAAGKTDLGALSLPDGVMLIGRGFTGAQGPTGATGPTGPTGA